MTLKSLLLTLLVVIGLQITAGEEAKSLYTKAPEDWRAEVIPFPLDFAPDIPLTGVEELRFAPGMFKADQTDYFTYSFIWWLEGRVEMDEAMLTANLKQYYDGLYKAVSKKEHKDLSSFKYKVKAVKPADWYAKADSHFTATLTWIDPFVTEEPLVLKVRIAQWYCEKDKRTAGYFMVSPQDTDHPLWSTMAAMEAASCSK